MAASSQPIAQAPAATRGLMAFWSAFEPDYLLRYQQWHNCEHMRERVSLPGFRIGRRYRLWTGEPWFLMMYEGDQPSVFSSPDYQARLNQPTPWTREALPQFRNAFRNVYELEECAGAPALWDEPYLLAVRFGIHPHVRPESASQCVGRHWLASVAALPAVRRARLYRLDASGSSLATRERSLHGSGPGQEPYLVLAECAVPRIQDEPNWPGMPDSATISSWVEENFWIEFALHKPTEGEP